MLRMIRKTTKEELYVVKAVMTNTEMFNKIIKDGYIKLGYARIKVTAWRFGTTPDQCFKCQKFGHSIAKCTQEAFTCLRCSQSHHFSKCNITDPNLFLCSNCGLKHAACSKQCEKLIQAVEKKKNKQENQIHKNHTKSNFTRVESTYKKHQQEETASTLNFLKFIIDLVKNLNKITSTIHEDPEPLLRIVDQHLGQQYSKKLGTMLFEELEESDHDLTNPEMENEFEQND